MTAPRPLSVSRPSVPTPAPQEPSAKAPPRYRAGKTMVSVDLTADQHELLAMLTFDLRKKRPRRADGRAIAQVDVVKEALDDFFEKHGAERVFQTRRQP